MAKYTFVITDGQLRNLFGSICRMGASVDHRIKIAYAHPGFHPATRRTFTALEMETVTVFTILHEFSEAFFKFIQMEDPGLFGELKTAIQQMAGRYGIDRLEMGDAHARGLLAPDPYTQGSAEFAGHGRIDGRAVYLPDLVIERKVVAATVQARDMCWEDDARRLENAVASVDDVSLSELHDALQNFVDPEDRGEDMRLFLDLFGRVQGEYEKPELMFQAFMNGPMLIEPVSSALKQTVREQRKQLLEATGRMRLTVAKKYDANLPHHKYFGDTPENLVFNLCDTLSEIKRQLDVFRNRGRRPAEHDVILIGAPAGDFSGYRRLQRDGHELPMIGANAATIFGASRCQGWPIISASFPCDLWQRLKEPHAGFLQDASTEIAESYAVPVVPGHIDGPEQDSLGWFMDQWRGDLICGKTFETALVKTPELRNALAKLGVFSAARKAIEQVDRGDSRTQAIRTFEFLVRERRLYLDWRRDQKLRNLQPLHKRILGLVEAMLIPLIKQKGLSGNAASGVWKVAFARSKSNRGLSFTKWQPSGSRDIGVCATLETNGSWVICANGKAAGIGLSDLLDGIAKHLSEATGVRINLCPSSAQEQADQLAKLADKENMSAAWMTFFLGNLAITLRNAIEHGHDQVRENQMYLDLTDFWKHKFKHSFRAKSDQENLTAFDYLVEAAKDYKWPCTLPSTLPIAANSFVLCPASLRRCLVLLSLVFHAAQSHLGVSIK